MSYILLLQETVESSNLSCKEFHSLADSSPYESLTLLDPRICI